MFQTTAGNNTAVSRNLIAVIHTPQREEKQNVQHNEVFGA